MSERRHKELCEHCGSPLDESSGLCWSCTGGSYLNGNSPVGAAPLERFELSKVLGRGIGERTHGAYSLSMQQAEGMSHLRDRIGSIVNQFNASPETKNSIVQTAERNAIKLMSVIGPTKAAIASVALEFMSLGRSLGEVSLCIARAHPRIGSLSSVVLEVLVLDQREAVSVLVNDRQRVFKSYSQGPYRRLRIPVYCWDAGAAVVLVNAVLCKGSYPAERVKPIGRSKFTLVLPEKSFQLFKILEEAKLSGIISEAKQAGSIRFSRKYSIAKLPFTEHFLRETGYLNVVNAGYAAVLHRELRNGRGRSPRKLAEEAFVEACLKEVPDSVACIIVKKYRLKPSKMQSLVVLSELDAWQ